MTTPQADQADRRELSASRPGSQAIGPAGRSVLIGIALGFTGIFVFFLVVCLLLGMSTAGAIAVAAFTGFWGGCGFGGMMGGILYQVRLED